MFDVFLAHNNQDKLQVREISKHLSKIGLKVWLDEDQIRPGQFFQEGIQQVIPKGAFPFSGSYISLSESL